MAAVLVCGPHAVLSYWSAAHLWKLLGTRAGAAIHVSAPGHPRGQKAIRVHRVPHCERTRRDGIPITTVPRTLLDLAAVASPKQLLRATNEAARKGWLNETAVRELIERYPRRAGMKAFVAVIAAVDPLTRCTRSDLEADFLALCRKHKLPEPVVNGTVEGLEVDMHWPGTKLIVELDSYEYHRTPAEFAADRRRDAYLKTRGYDVLRVPDSWLNTDPSGVATTIRQLLTT